MIKAEIVAHSLSPQGDELISVLATFPRIILAEVNTHRMLSKNTSSSRAIPFEKMVEAVQTNPFIPIAWQKHHSGMQGIEYFTDEKDIYRYFYVEQVWRDARRRAIDVAKDLHSSKVTKQLCNRLLEPFMWTTMLITGSREGWDNFFNLRCPKYEYKLGAEIYNFYSWKDMIKFIKNSTDNQDYINQWKNTTLVEKLKLNKGQAEIHIMALAESIWDSINESIPKQLKAGEWHIPFEDKIQLDLDATVNNKELIGGKEYIENVVKISTAMAAHTSYTTVGNEPVKSYEKWIELHDKLIAYNPPHSSPMEHCARVMNNYEYNSFIKGQTDYDEELDLNKCYKKSKGWCYNLKGFISYRHMIDNKLSF